MWFNGLANIDLSKADVSEKLAKFQNDNEFILWFSDMVEKATNRYRVAGCPETCNERVILQSILWYGAFSAFEMKGSLLSLPMLPSIDLNLYGDYGFGYSFGRNGFNEKIELIIPNGKDAIVRKGVSGSLMSLDGKGVYIRERKNVYPFIWTVYSFALKIADTMRTLDVQRNQIKRPYMIVAQETVVPSIKKWLKSVKNNEELIISSGVFDAQAVQAIPITIAADDLKATRELVEWYQSQFNQLCGIKSNSNTDKKANLLVDEIEVNDEQTEKDIQDNVDYMNEQLDIVNKHFGTHMRMEVNSYDDVQQDCGDDSDSLQRDSSESDD